MSEHPIHISQELLNGAHSIYAPSSAAMWLTCSGSLLANLYAKDSAGFEAAEGTVAHDIAEEWLKTGVRPTHRVGDVEWMEEGDEIFLIHVTDEMLAYIEEYVQFCLDLPGIHFTERRVYFSELTPLPNQGGTADFFSIDGDTLYIIDLKYGKGIKVYAEKNPQAMLYALGVIFGYGFLFNFKKVVIQICQPRMDHFDPWETTVEELLEWAEYARQRAFDAFQIDAPRTPSLKGCQWCKVKATCPAYVAFMERYLSNLADESLDDETYTVDQMDDAVDTLESGLLEPRLAPPKELTTAHLAKLLPFQPMIEKWFAAVSAELLKRANGGESVPGHFLAEGVTKRIFKDVDAAATTLVEAGVQYDKLWTKKFIGLTETEALLRKAGHTKKETLEIIAGLVRKPPGAPTLVPASSRKQALVDLADDSLDDESGTS